MSGKEGGRNFFSAPREVLRRFPLNYELIGRENIDAARELLAQGKTVIAILDHKSFADLVSGAIVTVKEGFDDLVSRANIIAKITYVNRFPSKQLLRNFNFRPVVPHTMQGYPGRDEINEEAKLWAQSLPGGSILLITPGSVEELRRLKTDLAMLLVKGTYYVELREKLDLLDLQESPLSQM